MQESQEYDELDEIFDVNHRVRDLLEDFEFVGNLSEGALIPSRPSDGSLKNNVKVALAATTLRVKSLIAGINTLKQLKTTVQST